MRLQYAVNMQRHFVQGRVDQRQLGKRLRLGPTVQHVVGHGVVQRAPRHLGNGQFRLKNKTTSLKICLIQTFCLKKEKKNGAESKTPPRIEPPTKCTSAQSYLLHPL